MTIPLPKEKSYRCNFCHEIFSSDNSRIDRCPLCDSLMIVLYNEQVEELLYNPNLIEEIQKEFDNIGVVKERKNRLIVYFAALSAKLLPKPINLVYQGSSSSGKSWVTEASIINFPTGYKTSIKQDEKGKKHIKTDYKNGFGIVRFNDMTMASMYRIGLENPNFFHQKVIIQGEVPQKQSDEQERVQQLIRQLLSEGEATKTMVIDKRSITIHLKGRPAFITCDAGFKVDNQLINRTLLLNPDESDKQSKAILSRQGIYDEKPWLEDIVMKASSLLSQIHPLLESYQVVNPWGEEVAKFMLKISGDPQIRRTHNLIRNFIHLRTLLFQRQRNVVFREENPIEKYLLSTREDVIETLNLLEQTIQQTITRVSNTAIAYFQDISDRSNECFWEIVGIDEDERLIPKLFTYQAFADFKRASKKTVYPHLKTLVESNLLILKSDTKPFHLKLNSDRKSNKDGLSWIISDLKSLFPEKDIPEGLVVMDATNSQDGQSSPIYDKGTIHDIGDQPDVVETERNNNHVLDPSTSVLKED